MMKRVMLLLVVGFCMSGNLGAMGLYNAVCNNIVGLGEFVEKSELPLIGKLTNMLPFGMIKTSCKEYPGQTMMICTGLLFYILSKNEAASSLFNEYADKVLEKLGINRTYRVTHDDTLFVFDGDDEDDAEEQMDMEDELLSGDSWRSKKNQQSLFVADQKDTSKIKFI